MTRYWFKFLTNGDSTPLRPPRNLPQQFDHLSSLTPPRDRRTGSPGGLSRRSVSPERSRLNV
eukprot:CAMPEP_0201522316 /NCGR_PEP_ID=MMETSP0161_2-20130828/16926_1 /ASSEMBLY_ACC=CAM_ASM_000251 /TAXON_ID=180227 /ORGANISM="Neoparamoeba aestuarina, Strain SoJaBio B1-5/56/2" /LENGTH=61 /DNA_ID=CAMNT_0047921127 /DNA_START=338 /DNA_END=523 /DNA_ORIENTATION=+